VLWANSDGVAELASASPVADCGVASNDRPHWLQRISSGKSCAPQRGQNSSSFKPQEGHSAEFSPSAAPQAGQRDCPHEEHSSAPGATASPQRGQKPDVVFGYWALTSHLFSFCTPSRCRTVIVSNLHILMTFHSVCTSQHQLREHVSCHL